MTTEQVAQLLAMVGAYYPTYKPDNKALTVKAWASVLVDEDNDKITEALKTRVRTSDSAFAPSAGELIGIARRIENPEVSDADVTKAWIQVRQAIGDSGYHAAERFAELSPNIQRAVGSPYILYEIGQSENPVSVDAFRGQFMKAYRAVLEERRFTDRAPEEVKKKLETAWPDVPKVEANEDTRKLLIEQERNAVPMPQRIKDILIARGLRKPDEEEDEA